MTTKIKAIKIDAENRDVYEVELDGTLENYYKEIGCRLIEKISIVNKHDLIIDEEATFKFERLDELRIIHGFQLLGIDNPIIGNALIVSYDNKGNWRSHKLHVKQVKACVMFGAWFANKPEKQVDEVNKIA